MNEHLVRSHDNRDLSEMESFQADRVAALLREVSRWQAQARYWQAVAEEQQSEIDFLKAELRGRDGNG